MIIVRDIFDMARIVKERDEGTVNDRLYLRINGDKLTAVWNTSIHAEITLSIRDEMNEEWEALRKELAEFESIELPVALEEVLYNMATTLQSKNGKSFLNVLTSDGDAVLLCFEIDEDWYSCCVYNFRTKHLTGEKSVMPRLVSFLCEPVVEDLTLGASPVLLRSLVRVHSALSKHNVANVAGRRIYCDFGTKMFVHERGRKICLTGENDNSISNDCVARSYKRVEYYLRGYYTRLTKHHFTEELVSDASYMLIPIQKSEDCILYRFVTENMNTVFALCGDTLVSEIGSALIDKLISYHLCSPSYRRISNGN